MCFGGIPSVVARLEFVIFSRLLPFVQMQGYPLLGNKMAASSSQAPFPDIRAELAELVKKKHDQTESLLNLERQIYAFEGSYLEDTAPYGNVIKGWEGYLNTVRGSTQNKADVRKKKRISEADRLFSNSSVTSQKAINPRMVNEMESSVQEVPSELSIHGSVPEDMSDSMSQTSSLAGEDRPGTSSLAFGGGSAYKKKRGPLAKQDDKKKKRL